MRKASVTPNVGTAPQGADVSRRGLAAFASARKPQVGPGCWACSLPADIRDDMAKGYRDGVQLATIRAWLADECGFGAQATKSRVGNHLKEHVGRDAA